MAISALMASSVSAVSSRGLALARKPRAAGLEVDDVGSSACSGGLKEMRVRVESSKS